MEYEKFKEMLAEENVTLDMDKIPKAGHYEDYLDELTEE